MLAKRNLQFLVFFTFCSWNHSGDRGPRIDSSRAACWSALGRHPVRCVTCTLSSCSRITAGDYQITRRLFVRNGRMVSRFASLPGFWLFCVFAGQCLSWSFPHPSLVFLSLSDPFPSRHSLSSSHWPTSVPCWTPLFLRQAMLIYLQLISLCL